MITRDLLQGNALEYYKRNRTIAIYWGTGIGKSKAACLCIEATDTSQHPVLIVADTQNARDHTWPQEIAEWIPHKAVNVQIVCIASLHKIVGNEYSLIIIDEAHMLTAGKMKFFNFNIYHGLILLTATPPEEKDKRDIFKRLVGTNTLSFHIDAAIQEGMLNNYRIIAFTYEIEGLEFSKYLDICRILDKAKSSGNREFINAMAGKRMHYIYNLASKRALVGKLVEKSAHRRKLVFCPTIPFADSFGYPSYHSGSADKSNLDKFRKGEINTLCTVQSLRAGGNYKDLMYAIIAQVQGKKRNLIQTLGRQLRGESGQTATIWTVIAKNTIDLTWFRSATKELDQKKIFYHPHTELLK
jgi:superfamily II DNA or RNA helicase